MCSESCDLPYHMFIQVLYIRIMYLVSPVHVKDFCYGGLVAHYLFLISERVHYLGWEGRGGLKVNIQAH